MDYEKTIKFIKSLYPSYNPVPLHVPVFLGNEKKYLANCIDTTFVSYVGEYVTKFEQMVADYTGAKYAIATTNGTLALHTGLIVLGIQYGDEVITQALTFVATANAIKYCGADPIFIDSEKSTLGMSPEALENFLTENTEIINHICFNKKTKKKIAACIPVHVFGHPVRIDKIVAICDKFHIPVLEDAAESIGSFYKSKHTGTFGKVGIISFNGNKTITTGAGGMIITNDQAIAERARHITTTAKIKHAWEFDHDELGYNYRMSNVNAAIGCAQMEKLEEYLKNKRELAEIYHKFFEKEAGFVIEPESCQSNYWLNAIILKDKKERDQFLEYANNNGVMARPIWRLMNKLAIYKDCQTTNLANAEWLEERVVNIPSSVRLKNHG